MFNWLKKLLGKEEQKQVVNSGRVEIDAGGSIIVSTPGSIHLSARTIEVAPTPNAVTLKAIEDSYAGRVETFDIDSLPTQRVARNTAPPARRAPAPVRHSQPARPKPQRPFTHAARPATRRSSSSSSSSHYDDGINIGFIPVIVPDTSYSAPEPSWSGGGGSSGGGGASASWSDSSPSSSSDSSSSSSDSGGGGGGGGD